MEEDGRELIVEDSLQQNDKLEAAMIHRDKSGAIRELFERGIPKKAIARALAIDIKTVRRHLRQGGWVPYQRAPSPRKALSGIEEWLTARAPEVAYKKGVKSLLDSFFALKLSLLHGQTAANRIPRCLVSRDESWAAWGEHLC